MYGDQNFLIPGCKVHWTISVEIILDGISCSDFYFFVNQEVYQGV